jgi:hypothetical protein
MDINAMAFSVTLGAICFKPMKYLIIICSLMIISCNPKPKNNITAVVVDTISSNTKMPITTTELPSINEEDFHEFLGQFRNDSAFQLQRVKFPFNVKSWDIEDVLTTYDIFTEDWKHLRFDYKNEYSTRPIDAYKQEIKVYPDSAKIEYRGIDNGIYLDYEFYRKDGKWYLESEKDYSN